MYCSSCGGETQPGLNFCKRCGASVGGTNALQNPDVPVHRPMRVGGMMWAISLFGVVSFMFLVGGLIALAALSLPGSHPEIIAPVAMFGSLTIFGVVAMMLRFVQRMALMSYPAPPPTVFNKNVDRASLDYDAQQGLPPQRPVMSVTEHTTRQFDLDRIRKSPE